MGNDLKKGAKNEFEIVGKSRVGTVSVESWVSVTDHLDDTDMELIMAEARKRAREKLAKEDVKKNTLDLKS